MQVTKNITLDLLETGSPVIIKAKQNDRNTRYIAAHLYVGRLDYPVPSGTEIAFRYKKPDGTAGFYDALPDNSPAITVSGNTVTVELVEQVLTVAGCVHCEINMYNAAAEKLTTFTFKIAVEESVLTDAEIISSDYYNVLTEQISKALQAVTDATEQAENAAQSAQDAADSAAMSKDWAAGQPVTYSGTPVSIAYAGAQRIASITAYGETPQGGTVEAPVALTGISSITVNDDVTELPIPRPLRRVGDVKDKCVTRQGHEGVEKLVVTYNVGFVELDGTEVWARYARISTVGGNFYEMPIPKKPKASNVQVTGTLSSHLTCDNAYTKKVDCVWAFVNTQGAVSTLRIGFSDDSIDTAEKVNAYLAAQKAAGTPVQVAYQLAAPEVYATDPVDFDNTAGPLTVMTGGEVEVRMTELVGSRSPELTHKLDKTGDGSNVTAAFTEAEQDADIQTGEELTVLFGKIKKRFSVVNKLVNGAVYPNLLDNSDFTNLVNQRGEAVYDYLTGIGYGPDRWQLVEAKYTLASQTVTSAGSSHTYGSQLRQIIPLEKIKIGDTVTASISTESGILNGTAKLELKIDTSVSDLPYVIEQDWGGVKIGCIKENVCHVIVFLKENKSVKINWVKLEKGGVATPYVPKGYGAELAECLRYFQRVHADWRIYPTLKDMLYRFSQSTLQVMRIKPTISAHGTPYTFGCTINALDAQPMAFTVETKITEQGQNAAAASMLGYFDLSADL